MVTSPSGGLTRPMLASPVFRPLHPAPLAGDGTVVDRPLTPSAFYGLIVADDVTGAADSAIAFASRGMVAHVSFGLPATGAMRFPEILSIDTDSRCADPVDAARTIERVVKGVLAIEPRVPLFFKKIDSTLRGNIGAETAAMLRATSSALALVAPAFPSTGRICRGGVQYANGIRVGSLAPMFDELSPAAISTRAVREGRLPDLLGRAAQNGADVVVVDGEADSDLDMLAQVGGSLPYPVLWVGSGGLAAALARDVGPSAADAVELPAVSGPVLVVVGSATRTASGQAVAVAERGAELVSFPATVLLGGEGAGGAACAGRVAAGLASGADVVVTIAEGSLIPAEDRRSVIALLAAALAAERIQPSAVIASGGETARSVASALGATGFVLSAEIEPGVVAGRLCGGPDCPIVTKGGSFGNETTLVRALDWLRIPVTRRHVLTSTQEIP